MAEKNENENDNKQKLRFESLSIHAGRDLYLGTSAVTVPVFASTSFVFNSSAHGADIFAGREEAYAYSRLANPTVAVFEQRIAALEGGVAALAASSGQAARWMAIAGLAAAGDNIVSASTISEESYTQFRFRFPSQGISVKFVDVDDTDALRSEIDEKTKAVYIESVSSVGLSVADIEARAAIAHEAGVPLVVDNTAGAGGYLYRPIEHGADIVIHSASEWIGGSGQAIAGAIIDSGKFPWNVHCRRFPNLTEPAPGYHGINFWERFGEKAYIFYVRMALLRDGGPCLNPFAASSLLAGLETLSVRMDRHSDNALALARWLDGHEKVASVVYPGLASHPFFKRAEKYLRNGNGGLLFFRLAGAGGEERSQSIIRKLKLVRNSDGIGTTQ
ncbi:hypothetical protein VTN77DRAFT_7280 [Rasamsonia byssochlamydoides]|uniref:uncharacterized protein n=1 Tax=Rasamsonia byssochlamydoides TaxID=89139 RepID=UPI003743BFED